MAKKGRGRPPADDGSPSPNQWTRIKRMAADIGEVERFRMRALGVGTEIDRLQNDKRLSMIQMQTAVLACEIIGLHDRLVLGARRFPGSASYMTGSAAGGGQVDEARMTPEQIKERERIIRKAKSRNEAVHKALATENAYAVFEQIVLKNEPADKWGDVPTLARALDRIAENLNVLKAGYTVGVAPKPDKPKAKPPKSPPFWRAPGAKPTSHAWKSDPVAAAHRRITIDYLEALRKAREDEAAREAEADSAAS